jgi:hypothetical protein
MDLQQNRRERSSPQKIKVISPVPDLEIVEISSSSSSSESEHLYKMSSKQKMDLRCDFLALKWRESSTFLFGLVPYGDKLLALLFNGQDFLPFPDLYKCSDSDDELEELSSTISRSGTGEITFIFCGLDLSLLYCWYGQSK